MNATEFEMDDTKTTVFVKPDSSHPGKVIVGADFSSGSFTLEQVAQLRDFLTKILEGK